MLTALLPWWWRWAALGLLCASVAAFGWVKGNEHGTAKLDAYKGAQAIATVKLIEKRAQIVTQIQTKYVDRIKTVTVKGDQIIKEVPVYVTAKDDAGCVIPTGFVREYDAAWTGTPAGPASETDRRPSGVPLSEVATADAINAKSCLIYKEQRDGWIEFYKKLQQTR